MRTAVQAFYRLIDFAQTMVLIDDVVKSYRWLGHNSFRELNAFHASHRPGDPQWNRQAKVSEDSLRPHC